MAFQCGQQTNFLQANSFQLLLPRFPVAQYYNTDFVLPQVSLPNSNVATPFTDLRIAGDKPIFDPLVFSFMIDEAMSNYTEIFDWITKIGFAESYQNFTNYPNKDQHQQLGEQDAKIMILSNKGNITKSITFYDAIPISLSGIEFVTQSPDTTYMKASVTMVYSRFDFTD